jgi:hypothetical protein
MEPDTNPFAVLSLIVAPAILTNATSVLTMSTSARLARAVDRAREVSQQLEASVDLASTEATRRLNELSGAEDRALLLVRALSSFYTALGGFASATLLSLLGAVLVSIGTPSIVRMLEVVAVFAGLLAVASLVHGSTLLVRETRIAVGTLREGAAAVRLRAAQRAIGGNPE